MIYRKLDTNGDYAFGKNLQNFVYNGDAVVQAIKTNLLLFKGEWWEDTSDGLPAFQNILGIPASQQNEDAVALIVKERIASTKGVSKVTNCVCTYTDRQLTISYSIITDYSENMSEEVIL